MNIDQLERDLTAKKGAIEALLAKQMTAAETEKRERTEAERAEVETAMTDARGVKARIDRAKSDATLTAQIHQLTEGMTVHGASPSPPRSRRTIGDQFVSDAQYQAWIKAGGNKRNGIWSSPVVEAEMMATTFDTTSGSGGLLVEADRQDGFVPLLSARLVVADLIAPGTTDSNLITYLKELAFTNAAAAVAQAGTKPESTLTFEAAQSVVEKIAHWFPTTTEMLSDYPATRSIIDARLRLGLQRKEEDMLLNGSGTTPQIRGLMNLVGLTAAQARGADTNADAIFKQITTIATTVFVDASGIVMNPANWQTIQLTKNAAGNYMGSGPWAPAQPAQLWGLPVARTPSIVANTALVGDYRGSAQIFRNGGIRIEASNSHADFFIKNLVAILGEERLALAVWRDAAFGKVTGLN